MPNPHNPLLAFRHEVQAYLQASEHLVVAASSPPPFTEDELAMIRHYVAEVGKILPVLTKS
jgi:hypothetical protein